LVATASTRDGLERIVRNLRIAENRSAVRGFRPAHALGQKGIIVFALDAHAVADAVETMPQGALRDGLDDARKVLDVDEIQVASRVDLHRLAISNRLDVRDATRAIDSCRPEDYVFESRVFEPLLGLEGIDRTGASGPDG
jgi:hypothetical protein